ncbi:unnamed protein product, partial [Onchocerca flexuosa]|uniref:SANT domain-containing protein n=1 Tax=Onchocerca flexuosa TaxID=387005 RepID=A0A183H3A4_9BILA
FFFFFFQTFREQIVTYGKNFAAIAEFLDRKSVKDCVLYYYLTKKRQNYKALMGKKRKKPPRCYKPPVMPRFEEIALKAPQDANDVTIVGSRELECCICKAKVNSGSNTGRILTRLTLDASGYDASSANEIDICVCQKCKAKGIKPKTVTRCQIGTCHNPRRKVKPTRPMPVKWKLITDEQKQFLMHQMLIPEDILKCCPACHKKISKQLDMLIAGELEEEMALWQKSSDVIWSTEEVEILHATVNSLGKDWDAVVEKMGNKYSVKQCQEQYEKIRVMESVKKEAESEDDVSEDDRENPQLHETTTNVKNDIADVELDPSGESSATLSADEAANQDDCVILLPPVAKSPSTSLYKPRFRGTSGLNSEIPILSTNNSHLDLSQVRKESEVMSSPLTCRKSDASASSSSDLSNMDDVAKPTSLSLQSSFAGSALLATLTSSTPDSIPARSSAQMEIDRLPQCSVSITRSTTSTVTQSVSSVLGNIVRGSITQGTPVMRPSSSPTPNNDLLEKVKQMQMLSAGTVATGASLAAAVAAASNIVTSSTPPLLTPTLHSNANAAAALPFLQNPLAAAAAATFPTAASDPNMSSLAAFYNQLAAMDPTMQYAMTMKIMQQAAQQHEYERRLAALRAGNVVDQYRQQALALGLSEQQQQQQMQNSQQQQQINALANDQAKLLLWQQLIQQSTSMKSLQQQQQLPQTISPSVNLQRTAAANTLLAATVASTNVRPTVADHLSGQSNAEQQQQQTKQLIASATVSSTLPTNMSGRVATGSMEAERANVQPLSSTTSQLYNDFRNAEQMRKELDESVRQLEAQQKLQDEIRYIEQQRRRVVEEEARISDELSRVSQIEYPHAVRSQDGEAARVHLQAIERLKERRTAVQHYLRAYDEGLKALSGRNALTSSSSSGVIVRGVGDERTTASGGPVSKGAMKEFPPSVTRIGVTLSSTQTVSGQSLIGIKRTLNDSALATSVEGRVNIDFSKHCIFNLNICLGLF